MEEACLRLRRSPACGPREVLAALVKGLRPLQSSVTSSCLASELKPFITATMLLRERRAPAGLDDCLWDCLAFAGGPLLLLLLFLLSVLVVVEVESSLT